MSGNSDNTDESFLSRWSRRKRGDEQNRPDASRGQKEPSEPGSSTEVEDDAAVDKVDLATLPKIEDLLPSSDISAFLQKGVPEELRRLALRKAWSLDPQIRDFIEVAENQYDWNKPDGVPGFGPLDPGTDIEALLKQATGQLEALEKQVETNSSESKGSDQSGDEPRSEGPVAEDQAEAAAAQLQPQAQQSVSAPKPSELAGTLQDSKPSDEASAPSHRRHGGALPS